MAGYTFGMEFSAESEEVCRFLKDHSQFVDARPGQRVGDLHHSERRARYDVTSMIDQSGQLLSLPLMKSAGCAVDPESGSACHGVGALHLRGVS